MKRYNEMNLRAILTGICMLCLFACNEDKGNYDYAEINRVSEFSDIKEEYSVEMGERLQISPKMEMEIDNPDDFDYTWYYKSEGAWNVLQEGRDFDFVIAVLSELPTILIRVLSKQRTNIRGLPIGLLSI